MAPSGEITLFKIFLLIFSISSFGSELKEVTNLLKKTHQECGAFELLSDRLLCYRRVKKQHRTYLDQTFKRLEEEKTFSKEDIKKLKKEIYSNLESVY